MMDIFQCNSDNSPPPLKKLYKMLLGIQFITVLVIKVTVSTTRKFTIHSWPEIRSSKLKLSNRKVESRIYD